MNYEDAERASYAAGNVELANAYARIMEPEGEVETLKEQIENTKTLEEWEINHGSANAYYAFFHACFDRLEGPYPCPNVSSDYDCDVIYQAIEHGEGMIE